MPKSQNGLNRFSYTWNYLLQFFEYSPTPIESHFSDGTKRLNRVTVQPKMGTSSILLFRERCLNA
jgi:hypothetical protein